MINQLQTDFGLSKIQAEKFKNISVTPKFFGNAFQTYQKFKNDKNTSFLGLLLEDREIDLFCNETLVKESFVSVNNEVKEVGLCNITFSSFLPLLISDNGNFNRYKIIPEVASIILSQAAAISNNNNNTKISQTRLNEIISSLNQTLGKFPPFDFSPFFGDNQHLLDAIFCGNFLSSLQHSTGQPQIQLNTLLDDFQKKVQEFVMKLTPGQSHSSGGVNKCGDMVVEKNKACDVLNFLSVGNTAGIKTMFNGLILVSPDVPITRELVRRLNQPLLKLNYFRDLISDFVQASDGLQDEISKSDLQKAAKVLKWILPISGLNGTATLSNILEHLFQNSSDSKSLLIMAKHFSNQFLNVSNCFRMDRFRFMKSEKDIEKQAMCLSNYDMYFSAIVFPDNLTNAKDLSEYTEYKIRHSHDLVDGTDFLIDRPNRFISRDSPFRDLKYLTFGFSFLQEAIEKSLISMFTNKTINEGLYAQQEPYPCVQQDWFNVTVFLSLFLILSWMIPSALLVKNIVWEKEVRLKEMMRIMGLGDMIHFLLILPQTGIGYGLTMIALAESSGMATWDGIYFIELDAYHVNLPKIIIAFVIDIFIYTILAWYISAVFPGTYGFCFQF
uniref:Uncharacterized protein n=1 Tax=Panagrolaimus davidi TaxID=227884 RepID=A0A914P896_9BILA